MGLLKRFEKRYPIFHALAIGAALIMMWRGIWGLMDKYLLPHDLPLSYGISLLVGLLILLLDDIRLKRFKD